MPLLFDSLFSSIALGHLMVDLLNGSRPVLLAYLSEPLGLTNTNWPDFHAVCGHGLDHPARLRLAVRPLRAALAGSRGPAVDDGFLYAGHVPAWKRSAGLPGDCQPGIGSAASGGRDAATMRGRTHYAGRETTAASFFFMFGQIGLFLGPIVAGPLLDRFGLYGLLIPAGLCLPIAMNAGWQLRNTRPVHTSRERFFIPQISATVSGL
jgi:hypothetical protein